MKRAMMPAVSLAAMTLAAPAAVLGSPRMEAGAGNIEKLMGEVKSELERIGSDVRKTAEEALQQAKKTGELTAETKEKADQGLKNFHELSGALNKLEGKLEALETRNLDLEQAMAGDGRGRAGGAQSVGQELAADEALKAWVQNGAQSSITLRPQNAITSVDGSAGGLIWPTEERGAPVAIPQRRLALRALLTQATTESDVVKYAKQVLRTNNAAPTAEGGTMPESSYGWDQAEANVRKISHITHISDEALADAGQLQSAIDSELRYGLDLEEEEQILSGDGTGQNLQGMLTVATAFSAAAGLPNATRIDRLRLGLLQVALANYAANGITLHPIDWAGIELLKDTTGRYIFGNPNELRTPMLWGLDVVPTLSHSAGEWMVGNFAMASTLYDRQQNEILISSEHGTNFVEGMNTMRGTKRLALAHKRPAALVTGNFTFA